MPPSLSDLPIRLDNSRYNRLLENWLAAFVFMVAIAVDVFIISLTPHFHFTIKSSLTLLVAPGIATLLWRMSNLDEASTLVIDKKGVHFSQKGKVRDYPWEEINVARRVIYEKIRGQVFYAVQIQLRGQFYGHGEAIDYIKSGEFGIPIDDFIALVNSGAQQLGPKA